MSKTRTFLDKDSTSNEINYLRFDHGIHKLACTSATHFEEIVSEENNSPEAKNATT